VCNRHTGVISLARARLLLVDDDEAVLSGLKVILEAHEFDVSTAPSVVEALRLITTERFDVLISDLHMPGAGDGLIVVGAMRHANPAAVTVVLSANPDMAKATASMLREADEILVKPPRVAAMVEAIRQRMTGGEQLPRFPAVESIATVLERERAAITQAWLMKMTEIGSLAAAPISTREQTEHLPEALSEILYRLRYPQPLGLMTLFSMASLQHGARRRRQGLRSTVLVEEARALQVALFQSIEQHMDQIDLGQLPTTLMAIADEVNAQLLQSLSGYENEKPVEFPGDDAGPGSSSRKIL
jgi:DNA-binding NarL/FixJ family response regulator